MKEWSVLIEARAAQGKRGSLDPTDSRVGDFLEALADWGGSVGADSGSWSARITVAAKDIDEAITRARVIVVDRAMQCRFPNWPIERVEAVDADVLDAELEKSNFPNLVGSSEVAEMLGVTRQRLHQIRSSGRFPQPIAELGATPVWLRPAVEVFLASWDRSPGRPVGSGSQMTTNQGGHFTKKTTKRGTWSRKDGDVRAAGKVNK